MAGPTEEEKKAAWAEFDKDGEGVTLEELGKIREKLGMPEPPAERLEKVKAQIATNGNGKVTMPQLMAIHKAES